jgi:hypothetical protein
MARSYDPSEISGFRRNPNAIGTTFSPAPSNPFGSTSTASTDPFSMFDDPATNLLMQTIKKQMAQYNQPVTLDKDTAGVLDYLRNQMGGGPQIAGNGLLGDFVSEGRQRIAELNQEPFSASEEEALKTKAKDSLTIDRDTQRHLAEQDIARRGMADSSGVLQDRLKSIDASYTAADAKNANDLMLYIAGERQNRHDKAAALAGQLSAAGAADAQMTNQAREAASARVMSAAQAIANIAAQQRGEGRANQQQVLNLAAMMAQLPMDRLNSIMGIINGTGGGPAGMSSLFGNTLSLSNAQQGQQNANNAGQAAFLQGLSQLAAYFANRGKN